MNIRIGSTVHYNVGGSCRAAILVHENEDNTFNLTWFGNIETDKNEFGLTLAADYAKNVSRGFMVGQWHMLHECG